MISTVGAEGAESFTDTQSGQNFPAQVVILLILILVN